MTHFVWVIEWIKDGRGFPCLFHWITGFYCPGCGGTRAIRALLRGDVVRSFCYHPFVLYAVAAVLAEGVFCVCGRLGGKQDRNGLDRSIAGRKIKYNQGFQRRYGRWVLGALCLVGVNWVVKNGFLLAGVDLLVLLGE